MDMCRKDLQKESGGIQMNELSVRQYLHNDGSGLTLGYDKREADKFIAELEKKLDIYKRGWMENDKVNANQYAEIRKAKRALWIHRAIVAKKIAESYKTMVKCHPFYGSNYRKWQEVERKCRAKAEEYK